MNKSKKNIWGSLQDNAYLLYTVLFILTALIIFSVFYLGGLTFISKGDGTNQHVKALVYYSEYLRDFVKNLIYGHRFVLPEWEAGIGEGGDILSTLHYYAIGDPLTLLSVFFDRSNIHICYAIIQILRLYLAGLSFLLFSRYTIPDCGALRGVSGALMYCFGSWGLRWTVDHPYFLTPLIYLPLLILGIEKILREKKILVFTLAVMFCSLSNFYFFYMCGIMAAGYTVLRLALVYRRNKEELFRTLLRIVLSAVWGFALSAVILLPQLYSFLGNPRVGYNAAMKPVISLEDMCKIPEMLLDMDSYWSISALAVPALILLFTSRKKHLMLKIFAAAVPVMLIFKIFGSIFNGFSHSVDRWSFAVTFLSSYIFVLMWPEYIEGHKEKRRPMFIASMVYFLICILLPESGSKNFLVSFSILGLLLVLLLSDLIAGEKREYLLLASSLACVLIDGLYMYSPEENDYAGYVREEEGLYETLYKNESETVRAAAALDSDEGFYRYSGELGLNSGFLHGLSSTSFYWSTVSPWGQNFRSDLALLDNDVYIYSNYDRRTAANAVSAVKYYVSNSEKTPFGYSFAISTNVNEELENRKLEELKRELGTQELSERQINSIRSETERYEYVFKNDYALPVGFTYDSYISREDWLALSPAEREWIMLDAAVLEGCDRVSADIGELKAPDADTSVSINSISADENIRVRDNLYTVTDSGSLELKFRTRPESETYLYIKGVDFEPIDEYSLYFGDDEKYDPQSLYNRTNFNFLPFMERIDTIKDHFLEKEVNSAGIHVSSPDGEEADINYVTPYKKNYGGRHDFIVNLGYNEEPLDSLTISFSNSGIFKIDGIEIYSTGMEAYPEKIERLKENVLENEVWEDDTLSGTVRTDRDKILYFALPYSTGWSAQIDGEPAALYCANDMYMAALLPAGDHSIRLTYKTPLLREGARISAVSLVLLAGYIIINRRKKIAIMHA
ncbi:MAG: YfhO family protein [Lachnospiraceae bacterium]|nr:YfhO family protein [Lachnospiraceae bacterium]